MLSSHTNAAIAPNTRRDSYIIPTRLVDISPEKATCHGKTVKINTLMYTLYCLTQCQCYVTLDI